ncbi:MAG: serine/threonine-protein kinase, partial [Sodalinema sp.]|uniref:protein kinase domain-containing protein n=1 Tax=Sodalinema sp. TaxID=3080550 RepID=UPI00396F3B51
MQPPLPADTLLQQRYSLIRLLGQGGFGRTYLAEDRGRFNAPCAVKEFAPTLLDTTLLDKAKELFEREAEVLYQLQHSQIPQFQAIFEENQRLFIVRDYVPGETYESLLRSRGPFSEAEVTQFLRDILPVLDYIHNQGIIHRDLSPENIIQRQSDRLPVPIDFGVVKEIASQLQAAQTQEQSSDTQLPDTSQPQPPIPNATLVGKPGYAPPEQLHQGRAYPHSDLYALAVTAIVLLTGEKPANLYNDDESRWTWQQAGSVSPQLAAVLNKMLSDRTKERYLTAQDVQAALLAETTAAPGVPDRQASPEAQDPNRRSNPPSSLPTVMVSRSPDTVPPNPGGDRATQVS